MILVTGGAGYIGSHTVLELLQAGKDVLVIDNLSNSSQESLKRVSQITGKEVKFVRADVRDEKALEEVFANNTIDSVVHFAGLKAVGESNEKPIEYYQNNVGGTLALCHAMQKAGVFKLVFSSSATVYGDPEIVPIKEDYPTGNTTNPYGTSKYMVERILMDLSLSSPDWRIALLRYFNPVGAHSSGQMGEDPNGIPNNLVPYISQVAVGKLPSLQVFGDDYPTKDGTGIRDYIHVTDLALGHLAALNYLESNNGCRAFNLGTGKGYSVLEVIKAFEEASGVSVSYNITARRKGDIAECFASAELAKREMDWEARRELSEMMRDAWNWQKRNPNGY